MSSLNQVIVCGGFDDLKSRDLRFLEEAAKLGELSVLVWPDEALQKRTGYPPRFPLLERLYYLKAVRYVKLVIAAEMPVLADTLPGHLKVEIWADNGPASVSEREIFCRGRKIVYRHFKPDELNGFPKAAPPLTAPGRKKVVVTGSYDWLHSGHVRFFEEASTYGDLYVVVGHDTNIRFLKGEGHPLLPQDERRYVAGSIKYVHEALVSSGHGWLDADPEIRRLKPDIYAVNEDGDKGGKREYCEKLGIQYIVLKRIPAPGLPSRSSTVLRGF
jgi:cytidyltransferase-like protein